MVNIFSNQSFITLGTKPKVYKTKSRKKIDAKKGKLEKKLRFEEAKEKYLQGKFKSLNKCARFYKLPYATLYRMVESNDEFKGSGRFSGVLKPEEEELIINHVKWRASVGCGLTWTGLQKLIQEILIGAKQSNPDRITGYEEQGQMPNISWVRRLAERHNLTLRSTMEISKGRQVSENK